MKKEYLMFLVFPISQMMMIAGDYKALKNLDALGVAGIVLSVIADLVLVYVLIHGSQKEKLEKELEKNNLKDLIWQHFQKRHLECIVVRI